MPKAFGSLSLSGWAPPLIPGIASAPRLIIRKLTGFDRHEFERFLLRLDGQTRQDRFLSRRNDRSVADYARLAWRDDIVVVGAFADSRLAAVAELCEGAEAGVAEAAFTVARDFRNRGIGSLMLERLLLTARNCGYDRVQVMCVPTNGAMRKVALKANARLNMTVDEVTGEIRPAPRTVLSLMLGRLLDGLDMALGAVQPRRARPGFAGSEPI